MILSEAGFINMKEACDGVDALEKMQKFRFDFVICDWAMPNMDGLELFTTVKKIKKLKSIPFLMATSMSDATSVKAAIQLGVTHYITKPLNPDILCQKIIKALTKKTRKKKVVD